MNKVFPVEIRYFRTLSDVGAYVDKEITWYESFLKDYNESLGTLLREQGGNPEELEKQLREKGLAKQAGGKKGEKRAARRRELPPPTSGSTTRGSWCRRRSSAKPKSSSRRWTSSRRTSNVLKK